ncbi:MAG: tryptophan synthase subunit alpha [Bacteroidales bacterium]
MNKIDNLLNQKQYNILSVYFTAGYPELNSTTKIIEELENSGADLIEVGIPFSDPIADGPVIQYSNNAAIENGITLELIFTQLEQISAISNIPKIMMGYFNPVLKFGVERFCEKCVKVGIDGIIIPDLPLTEYKNQYQQIFKKYDIHFIFLVSPQTSKQRLSEIESLSTAFIYAVSTNSTTGGAVDFAKQKSYFSFLRQHLTKPFLIGFGVKDRPSFASACSFANGAIIGSAFIKALSEKKDVKNFIQEITLEK